MKFDKTVKREDIHFRAKSCLNISENAKIVLIQDNPYFSAFRALSYCGSEKSWFVGDKMRMRTSEMDGVTADARSDHQ